MGIIVQKFGGTSVAKPDVRAMAVGHVKKAVERGLNPVVVVSAMGRKGDPYATDTLIGLVSKGDGDDAGVSARDLDLLMGCGEIISTVVMSDALAKAGLCAVAMTGLQAGILTDDNFGDAHIVTINPDRVLHYLEKGMVPVIAGFQGANSDNELTTLGRGAGDTTAAAMGVALKADVVEIFTDVEGIMTADPRVEPEARVMETATYREVAEMAHMGAKVIHPRAVEIAMKDRVPLKIRCTMSDAPGTLITDSVGSVDSVAIKGDKVVTGIASIVGMALVRLGGSQSADNREVDPLKIFRFLAEEGVSVDLISVSPELISFIVKESDADTTEKALTKMGLKGSAQKGFAKVSAVGAGMRGVPGVMASVVEALASAGVNIYQTTDSHTTISCLVRQDDMTKAVRALHSRFGLS